MWVRYFVPEDGDDSNHPNVYQTDRVHSLEDLKKSFPLNGQFHFRFLKELDKMMVWMDATDNDIPLPVFQGGLFVKANRIRSESAGQDTSYQHKANIPVVEPISSSSARTQAVPPTTRQPSEKLLNFDHHDDDFDSPAQVSSPIPATSENLFDDNHDLLGFSTAHPSSNSGMAQKSSSNADLFGLETLQPAVATPTPSMASASAPMSSSYFPQGSMNPIMGNTGMSGNMPRPMGSAPMSGAPRPMGMNQQTQYNRGQQMNGGGYDPFSSLGSMQQRK